MLPWQCENSQESWDVILQALLFVAPLLLVEMHELTDLWPAEVSAGCCMSGFPAPHRGGC